jgi:hypothetical protein
MWIRSVEFNLVWTVYILYVGDHLIHPHNIDSGIITSTNSAISMLLKSVCSRISHGVSHTIHSL